MKRWAVVRFTFPGWHRWPEAQGEREYLASRHRHLFHVEVRVATRHNDREVEFHDLLDHMTDVVQGTELGRSSCEDLATAFARRARHQYPYRAIAVSVFEDAEVGAVMEWAGNEVIDEESDELPDQ